MYLKALELPIFTSKEKFEATIGLHQNSGTAHVKYSI